jgi:hypothetical protein
MTHASLTKLKTRAPKPVTHCMHAIHGDPDVRLGQALSLCRSWLFAKQNKLRHVLTLDTIKLMKYLKISPLLLRLDRRHDHNPNPIPQLLEMHPS